MTPVCFWCRKDKCELPKPLNELRKIFRQLDFRERSFMDGKKQPVQVFTAWFDPNGPVLLAETERERQRKGWWFWWKNPQG
jgi:hypothetical protein